MTDYALGPHANAALDDIFLYTREHWGEARAERYIDGLFGKFEDIANNRIISQKVPEELVPDSWRCRHERHVIYWKHLADGRVGIFAILHERMHQAERLAKSL
ncbi:type II toxin-antitoxin system RelE/ParE family toxin [Minwuia sp.]|uniref:type II toxin-antitoxin system RelE/ParE family toxin n=1 Tax=Minwuia sp. TaxID=2493630 RepID=UPI003A94A12B